MPTIQPKPFLYKGWIEGGHALFYSAFSREVSISGNVRQKHFQPGSPSTMIKFANIYLGFRSTMQCAFKRVLTYQNLRDFICDDVIRQQVNTRSALIQYSLTLAEQVSQRSTNGPNGATV